MKKTKTKLALAFLIPAGMLFLCCSENQTETNTSLARKLSLFEDGLKSKNQNHTRGVVYNVDSLANDKNEYDNEGRLFWDIYKDIEAEAEVHIPNPLATYQSNLEPFVNLEIQALDSISSGDLNTEEKLLMDSFEDNFELSVELILDYEDFVYDNFSDQSDVENFLITLHG